MKHHIPLLVIVLCFTLLPGCLWPSRNLSPEQIQAMGEFAKIQKASGCAIAEVRGSGGFVSGEMGGVLCVGMEKALTANDVAQMLNGVSITVSPQR